MGVREKSKEEVAKGWKRKSTNGLWGRGSETRGKKTTDMSRTKIKQTRIQRKVQREMWRDGGKGHL